MWNVEGRQRRRSVKKLESPEGLVNSHISESVSGGKQTGTKPNPKRGNQGGMEVIHTMKLVLPTPETCTRK